VVKTLVIFPKKHKGGGGSFDFRRRRGGVGAGEEGGRGDFVTFTDWWNTS